MRSASSTPTGARRLRSFPYLLIFGTGIALSNTMAMLEALCHVQGTFVRTPKFGIAHPTDTWVGTTHRWRFPGRVWGNSFLAVYSGYGVYLAVHQEGYFLLPFLLLYTLGFAAVGGLSFVESFQTVVPRLPLRTYLRAAAETHKRGSLLPGTTQPGTQPYRCSTCRLTNARDS